MIILLRGHIRNSFNDNRLYDLIKDITMQNNITIYIHTWHVLQNSLSWREIDENNTSVSTRQIHDYFKDLSYLIKEIIIDDDSKINLIGNLEGKIIKCPTIAWKNLWFGNDKIINYIAKIKSLADEVIVNTRFDIFDILLNSLEHDEIINFINKNKNRHFDKNYFINEYSSRGIDNIFIGNTTTMKYLLNNLHNNLDSIVEKFKFLNLKYHEEHVYYENSIPDNFDFDIYRKSNNLLELSNQNTLRHFIRNINKIEHSN